MSEFQNMVCRAYSYIYKGDKYSKHTMYKLHKYNIKIEELCLKEKKNEYVRKVSLIY